MIPFELAKELHEVPESIIKEYARHFTEIQGIEKNTWVQLLECAKIFRHAGVKPIFLANHDGTKFAVSSDETYLKRLH